MLWTSGTLIALKTRKLIQNYLCSKKKDEKNKNQYVLNFDCFIF